MKKLLKVILGLATAAAAVAGVVYFLKKVVMKDYLDDYDEDDFDIDFNAQKYLIETRCSGALTSPYSAMAIEWAA